MILLLFSGGLDSMVLAEKVLQSGQQLVTVFFRYPHPAAPEEYRAVSEWHRRKLLDGHSIRHIEVSLPLWGCDKMSTGAGEEGPRVLPGRNQVMLSNAINIAASIGAHAVIYGANLDDSEDYPDCRPMWVELMNRMGREWGVTVKAPLLYKTKNQIVGEARDLGVIFDRIVQSDGRRLFPDSCCQNKINLRFDHETGDTECVSCGQTLKIVTENLSWSCYQPKDGRPCGTCDSCKSLKNAMPPMATFLEAKYGTTD